MFQAGLRAHYVASVLAAPMMTAQGSGLIVNISAFAAEKDDQGVMYGVAKSADNRMAACMAWDLRKYNVAAVALYPGLVRTESVLKAAAYFDLSNSESPQFIGRVVAGLAVLIVMGRWESFWPAHEHSDWRAAAVEVNSVAPDSRTAVICPSPFIEARPPEWRPDYPLPGFLYSHLPVYPIRGHAYLFPFDSSPEAEQYAAVLLNDVLLPSPRFVVYGGNGSVRIWRRWFAARPELSGWRYVRRYFGDVELDIFEK
jgi:hypothetical protein